MTSSRLKPNGLLSRKGVAKFAFLILFVYILPVVLLLVGIVPFSQRFTVLLVMAVFVLVLERARGRDWRELGFRTDNLRQSLVVNVAVIVVLGACILTAMVLGGVKSPATTSSAAFYVFYVLISSPSQEFLFRSVVFTEMNHIGIKSGWWQIPLSTVIYVFPHLIYKNWSTIIVVAFIGTLWAFIYRRYPNWVGVALSHAALGALSIVAGLV